jgi:hypothetical protein
MATHQKLNTCDAELIGMAASRSNPFTSRKAVHPFVRLGYLYDACYDEVRYNSNINFGTRSMNSRRPPECSVITYDTGEWEYLSSIFATYSLQKKYLTQDKYLYFSF